MLEMSDLVMTENILPKLTKSSKCIIETEKVLHNIIRLMRKKNYGNNLLHQRPIEIQIHGEIEEMKNIFQWMCG